MLLELLLLTSCPIQKTYPKTHQNLRSQFGQDAYINKQFKKNESGVYLDIGCNDGIDGSNTFYFYNKGWYGKCLEADPRTFDRIKINSQRLDGINIAVSQNASKMQFMRIMDHNNGLSGLSKSMSQHDKALWKRFSKVFVSVYTVPPKKLLHKYYNNYHIIDFVSLDIEGSELDVIKSWPFEKWCVRYFSIEDNNWCNSLTILNTLKQIFIKHAYKHINSIGMDHIFSKKC